MDAQTNHKNSQGTHGHRMKACFGVEKQQNQSRESTEQSSQKEKIQLRKIIDGDAFSHQQDGQKTQDDQWCFTLWNIGNHDGIDFSHTAQQEKKQHGNNNRDNRYLENSQVFFWIWKIRIIPEKVKQGGKNRNKYRME